MRKFGWIRIAHNDINEPMLQCSNYSDKITKVSELIKNLGLEPGRDLTLKKFREIFKSSKRPVKLLLMDQTKIAGVGNIYANEVLFLSGIHPQKIAIEITEKQAECLYHQLLKLLKKAIELGGASSNLYRDAFGQKGQAQEHFLVYGREGEKCINNCTGIIKKIKLGGRGTFFCQRCQN
ncbi:hypothetical protein A2Y99_03160 [Candidatus Gottesmanbacteria bacterium RBG_13_37_7]|uniref:DNA-(apurinic or apyrimidinic site) lyase n=1 Tax=Candidatus Gottesmanbacteria bacterium RBG_13_37_7 TaxID=1798369 RepID=A0A1F5YGF4_9BACT|nr:MAG: hypothetical protein A2Y99_03160 [Candidatus Gottesmanbacteria bacterium RBG_13_37_7]